MRSSADAMRSGEPVESSPSTSPTASRSMRTICWLRAMTRVLIVGRAVDDERLGRDAPLRQLGLQRAGRLVLADDAQQDRLAAQRLHVVGIAAPPRRASSRAAR